MLSGAFNWILDSRSLRLEDEKLSLKEDIIRDKKPERGNMKCENDRCRYKNQVNRYESMSKLPLI